MYKALFFDIDGTLVPFGHTEPQPEVLAALEAVQRRGVKVFIATGRQMSWITNLGTLRPDGYVTVNGNVVLEADGRTMIFCNTIDAGDMDRLTDYAARPDALPLMAVPPTGQIVQSRPEGPLVKRVRQYIDFPYVTVTDFSTLRGCPIAQLMVFGTEEERRRSGIFDSVLTHCDPTSWNPYFCDVIPRGCDKAVGIDRMIERHGIALSETMAFGDGGNDIAMLAHAGMGVAMGNAANEVKRSAGYVTDEVSRDGVVAALKHFGLL